MKYRLSFFKGTMAFAILLLFSFSSQLFSTCIDVSKNQIFPMFHSIGPAHQVIKTGETTTITEEGSYQLLENITGNVVVSADNVFIDLNGFTITPESGTTAILLTDVRKNIFISNGSIVGSGAGTGIGVSAGSQTIVIEDLRIADLDTGVLFLGTEVSPIKCCKMLNCFVANCQAGYFLSFVQNSIFEYCDNCCCVEVGFSLQSCKYNKIKKCKSVRVGSDESSFNAIGFWDTSGTDNLFYECMAEGIYKSSSDFCTEATGFLFDGTSTTDSTTESKIVNCLVDSVSAGDETRAVAYGIHLNMILKDVLPTCPLIQENIDAPITDVSWSPAGDKVAVSTLATEELERIQIYQFDCCCWSQVKTLTNPNIQHIEWDPTGRYLALSGTDSDYPNFKVYDSVYNIEFTLDSGDTNYNPVWSRDSKYVTYTFGGGSLAIYRVDGSGLTLVGGANFLSPLLTNITNHAISSDEKFLAFGSGNDLYAFKWSFLPPFLDATILFDSKTSNIGTITDVAFSPVANFVVAVGDKGAATGNIQIFGLDSEEGFGGYTAIDFGADILRVKFAPNGKYFAVLGTNGTVGIYRLDPNEAEGAVELYRYSLGHEITTGGIDWSPSGKYISLGGNVLAEVPDFAILEVANVPTKNVIVNNKIANVSGGICQTGIEGASCCNGIMKNIVYNACVPYGESVLNVWYNGLVGIDQTHVNVAVPPYGVVPFVPAIVT